MKIFLVGGLGFIGKRFIRKYSQQNNIVVYAIKNDIIKSKKFLEEFKVEVIEGAVEEDHLSEIINNQNPEVVIHLAALTGLVKCHDDPNNAFKINIFGTYNVVKSCTNVGCKLIFISSREVYGETISKNTSEGDVLLPNNVYGITKMLGENIVQLFGEKQNLDFTILRLTNVYGPEGDQYGAEVIINKAIKEKKIQILGGEQRLNYVYVDDVIEVIYSCITNKKSSGEIFNVGSRDTVSIRDFVDRVVKIMGEDIKIEISPMRETETTNFEPNLTRIQQYLQLPQTSLNDGIKKTIEWYSNKI